MRMRFKHALESGEIRARPLLPFAGCAAIRGVHADDGRCIPDLFLLGAHGRLGLVEAKLGSNGEFGLPLVKQLLRYFERVSVSSWSDLTTDIERIRKKDYNRRSLRFPAIARRHEKRHLNRDYDLFLLIDRDAWNSKKAERVRVAARDAQMRLRTLRPDGKRPRAWFVVTDKTNRYTVHAF